MSKERVRDMIHQQNGTRFLRVYKRDAWTSYLDGNDRKVTYTKEQEKNILTWMNTSEQNKETLDNIIAQYNVFLNTRDDTISTLPTAPIR